jgi:hypothetical protein
MPYISLFSDELGIAVLFEGVETKNKVHLAIRPGREIPPGIRFFPGGKRFVDPLTYQKALNAEIKTRRQNYRKSRNAINLERDMNRLVAGLSITKKRLRRIENSSTK